MLWGAPCCYPQKKKKKTLEAVEIDDFTKQEGVERGKCLEQIQRDPNILCPRGTLTARKKVELLEEIPGRTRAGCHIS